MQDTSTNNKRIAKNTLMLYFRMILVMCVSIYTSRVYLHQLGITDYGIYNVVGGFIGMFTALNGSFAASTTRFITYALGKGDKEQLNNIFSASLSIHICLGILIVLLLETIGLWFLNNKLVIPHERLYAANWIYQFIILSTFLNIMQVPFSGLINAHEDMGTFAWLSLLDVTFKLLIAYLISVAPFDKLIFFGLLLMGVTIVMISIYRIYCYRHYEECRYHLFWDKDMYKSMTSFAGWNIFGGLAWMLKDQGANVLLNLFFGPAINAARAVALQVSGAVTGFMNSFLSAVFPQITKYYAQGEIGQMQTLTYRSLRYSFMLVFFLAFPIMLNIDFILSIWLKEVPQYANIFVLLVFTDVLVQTLLSSSLGTAVSATGNVRNFQIVGSFIMGMIIPVSYVLLRLGLDSTVVFWVIIIFNGMAGLSRLYFAHIQVGFSVNEYLNNVLVPALKILALSVPIPLFIKLKWCDGQSWVNFIVLCTVSILFSLLSYILFGIKIEERKSILKLLKSKL